MEEEEHTQIQHMMEAAQQFGLDLNDPLIQQELQILQQQQMEKDGISISSQSITSKPTPKTTGHNQSSLWVIHRTWFTIILSIIILLILRFRVISTLVSFIT